jgi:hypothetical protein
VLLATTETNPHVYTAPPRALPHDLVLRLARPYNIITGASVIEITWKIVIVATA